MIEFRRLDYDEYLPTGVQGIWTLQAADSYSLDIIPDGHPEIIIPLSGFITFEIDHKEFKITEPSIVGQITTPTRFMISDDAYLLNLKLYPHYLGQLLGEKSKCLTNHCEACQTFSPPLDDAFAGLMDAYQTKGIIDKYDIWHILEALDQQFHYNQYPVLEEDLRTKFLGIKQLEEVSLHPRIKCSSRYLQKLYERQVGVSPHRYLKILKVKKASIMMASTQGLSLSSLYTSLGYYDASHFHKVFCSLSRKSPRQFIADMTSLYTDSSYLEQWDYS